MNFWADPVNFIAQWLGGLLLSIGASPELTQILLNILGAGILALGALFFCIFLIWLERKVVGRLQDRLGPNRVGPFGLIQPFADMLKIFTKELITPKGVDWIPYNLAPVLAVFCVLLSWSVLPLANTVFGVNLDVAVLFLIAAGGLGELGIILAGWGSNNKYALLGAFRAVAQLISYEVPMVIMLLPPVMLSGSMSLLDIVKAQDIWYLFIIPGPAIVFFLTQVAEVGRAPFNLSEAESELVAGFNIEYSGLKFGFFYVGEFLHAFTVSVIFATVFLGGWRGPYADQIAFLGFFYLMIKTVFVYFLVLLFTYTLPRLRIDQMMDLNWKILTPFSLCSLCAIALVDKLLQNSDSLVRGGGLLIVNLVLLFITIRIVGKRLKRDERKEFTYKNGASVLNNPQPSKLD